MKKLLILLLLAGCYPKPPIHHHQCEWRCILNDPIMNELMDQTTIASSSVASAYTQFRGLQQRQQRLQTHINNQADLISMTSDLVERGVASSIDLQTLLSFQGTLKAQSAQLQTNLDKVFYQLAQLVKMEPECLSFYVCHPSPLPIPLRPVPKGSCLDILSYYNNEERVAALLQAKEAAKVSYEMSQDLYTRGLKSSIELLSAHRALISSEDELIQAQVDLLNDYITLFNLY